MSVTRELLLNGNRMHHVIRPPSSHSESFVSGGAALQPQSGTSSHRCSLRRGTSPAALLILRLLLPISVRHHQLPFPYWIWINFISTEFCNTETLRKLQSSARKLLHELTNSSAVSICWVLRKICVMFSAIVNPVLSSKTPQRYFVFLLWRWWSEARRKCRCNTSKLLNQWWSWAAKPDLSQKVGP